VSVLLVVSHGNESNHDDDPVQIVGQHRAVGCRICPAKDGVEDTPSATAVDLRVAAVDVPYAFTNVVRSWSGSYFGQVSTDDLGPCVHLKRPDCLGEETGSDQVEEAGGDDEEDLKSCTIATPGLLSVHAPHKTSSSYDLLVQSVPNKGASSKTTDHSQRK